MKTNTITIGIVTALVLASGALFFVASDKDTNTEVAQSVTQTKTAFADTRAVVYKSPTCGCCEGHADAMREAGIDVEIVEMQSTELSFFKEDNGVPTNMQSCHTTILSKGDTEYVVEGHVPIEGMSKLITEQPDIAGIVLPGMPSGTPGMPGPKMGPYEIMTLEDEPQLYTSI